MKQSFLLTIFLIGASFQVQASHCWNEREITEAAHSLDEESRHFANLLDDIAGYTAVARAALGLANEAEHLHETAHDAPSCQHIRSDFRRMEDAFLRMKREFRNAHDIHHNPHADDDYDRVVSSYRDIERAVYADESGGGGGGHTSTRTIQCESIRSRPAYCRVGVPIIGILSIQRYSSAQCIVGRNVNLSGDTLIVTNGCRANFTLNVRDFR